MIVSVEYINNNTLPFNYLKSKKREIGDNPRNRL